MANRLRIRAACAAATLLLTLAGCGSAVNEGGSANSGPVRGPGGGGSQGDRATNGDGTTTTRDDAQSTFAVDVDTASYTYTRRQILAGQRPDPGTVRPEEFVNAFAQDYEQPAGNGFTVHADGSRMPTEHKAGGDMRLLRIGLQTRGESTETRSDATLTFVIDTSGSMGERGKLDLVQDALNTLVDRLRPTDSVAIVSFSTEARVVREMTPVSDAAALHDAITSLRTEASTNLEAGLYLGYQTARAGFRPGTSNRVILLSDGLANTGSTNSDEIYNRVREEAGKQIALLGVGVGSDYGDALMERLADGGDGFVVYVSDPDQARDVFVRRLPSNLAVRALDAKVQVTFNPSAIQSYRLIGYENRAVADENFRNNQVDGGEVGPGHSVTALYEVRLAEGARGGAEAARATVRWLDPTSRRADETARSVTVGDLDGAFQAAPVRLWVDYAAVYFAESLRGAREEQIGLDIVARIARAAGDRTGDRAVSELADLVTRADRMRR